jgi:hypothetical protein
MTDIEFVIFYCFEDILDEHLDVALYRDSTVDNDRLGNHGYQEDGHMDNKLNILADTV